MNHETVETLLTSYFFIQQVAARMVTD